MGSIIARGTTPIIRGVAVCQPARRDEAGNSKPPVQAILEDADPTRPLPPFVYYVHQVTARITDLGHPVVNTPGDLYDEVTRALSLRVWSHFQPHLIGTNSLWPALTSGPAEPGNVSDAGWGSIQFTEYPYINSG